MERIATKSGWAVVQVKHSYDSYTSLVVVREEFEHAKMTE